MPKYKYTDIDALKDFKALKESCEEGLSGEWDCSSDEGRGCFEAMIELLNRLDTHYQITKGA